MTADFKLTEPDVNYAGNVAGGVALGSGIIDEHEQMNLVVVGHVDHGKSTLVGRMLHDSGSVPVEHMNKVRGICERQGKEFEWAFLLDALEAEQEQGITIDVARIFFHTEKRHYIIIDAPGHIEFLKNMITGAARAEAAVLLIDADEGVRENSRRHGYIMSMLGIRQVVVAVNKMDLVDYDQGVFDRIEAEYRRFLAGCGLEPKLFVPVSAREGDNVALPSENTPWYTGPTVLAAIDSFEKAPQREDQPLRMPVQDVYKFNARGDHRRITAGRVDSGSFRAGDKVVFYPSNKAARIASIEVFSAQVPREVEAGVSTGIQLDPQIYIERGELMCHADDPRPPQVSTLLRVNLFWLGRSPMVKDKTYKLKLGTASTTVSIETIHAIIDASEEGDNFQDKDQVERHDVADLTLRCRNPIAFDLAADVEATGRFVLVDDYEIRGGGIVREAVADEMEELRSKARERDVHWIQGLVSRHEREQQQGHRAMLVLFSGDFRTGKAWYAKVLDKALHEAGLRSYLLDGRNIFEEDNIDHLEEEQQEELLNRFTDAAHLLLDSGLIVISSSNAIGQQTHDFIRPLLHPIEVLTIHVSRGEAELPEDLNVLISTGTGDEIMLDKVLPEVRRLSTLNPER